MSLYHVFFYAVYHLQIDWYVVVVFQKFTHLFSYGCGNAFIAAIGGCILCLLNMCFSELVK